MGFVRRRDLLRCIVLLHSFPVAAKNRAKSARQVFYGRVSDLVQSPEFDLTFCRVADADGEWLRATEQMLGEVSPWLQRGGARQTLNCRGKILAYERVTPGAVEGAWFHGSRQTLAVNRTGAVLYSVAGSVCLSLGDR